MARQGFLNGKLYTYTAEEEAAQDAEEVESAKQDAAVKYINERRVGTATTVGYGDIGEQLDQLYRDMQAGKLGVGATTGEWYVGITSVKTAFPKP